MKKKTTKKKSAPVTKKNQNEIDFYVIANIECHDIWSFPADQLKVELSDIESNYELENWDDILLIKKIKDGPYQLCTLNVQPRKFFVDGKEVVETKKEEVEQES